MLSISKYNLLTFYLLLLLPYVIETAKIQRYTSCSNGYFNTYSYPIPFGLEFNQECVGYQVIAKLGDIYIHVNQMDGDYLEIEVKNPETTSSRRYNVKPTAVGRKYTISFILKDNFDLIVLNNKNRKNEYTGIIASNGHADFFNQGICQSAIVIVSSSYKNNI